MRWSWPSVLSGEAGSMPGWLCRSTEVDSSVRRSAASLCSGLIVAQPGAASVMRAWRRSSGAARIHPSLHPHHMARASAVEYKAPMRTFARVAAIAAAVLLLTAPVSAQIAREAVVIGMEAEPPGLDPGQALG